MDTLGTVVWVLALGLAFAGGIVLSARARRWRTRGDVEPEFVRAPTLDECLLLCEHYLAAGRSSEAMVVCRKGIESAPDDPRGPVMLARLLLARGKRALAQKTLRAVLAQHPEFQPARELLEQWTG